MASSRKKQPREVRSRLLKATAEVAAEQGLDAVTIAEVSKRAGVTSGGLFHHFPSKKHLIDELINSCTLLFEKTIEELISRDPEPRGRFARAYLLASNREEALCQASSQMGNVLMAMTRDPEMSARWEAWLETQMKKYGPESDPVLGDIIRYASDGLWMEGLVMASPDNDRRQAAIDRLLEMTYKL